ncbi:helicase [Pseudactinotalea sp. HY160]|nr:helicase [Pseudactinotalea sp. HY160]
MERASDGWFVDVTGISGIVRDQSATFATALDRVVPLDPSSTRVVADESPRFRTARLWLESMIRRTALPINEPGLTVARAALADALPYQQRAAELALSPENLRPRILLADAVGLGKTIEIGMILAELVRRGRGERILVVTPKHVLEQMQFELWTRFALPFIRLDSTGIQRIRQELPAGRNPFTYYKRVIVSIDTLKSDQYIPHLRAQRWDAVVIDESHNVTNTATLNHRLADLLARNADALILASATPHNGRRESFAELIRMLEPSAVSPTGEVNEELLPRLVVRRHRNSPEVASVVGTDWAERAEPDNRLVAASPVENEIARELEHAWLWPAGDPPTRSRLFPWTLAKAFLSSPAAFAATVGDRLARLTRMDDAAHPPQPGSPAASTAEAPGTGRGHAGHTAHTGHAEHAALERLAALADRSLHEPSGKYDALLEHLREIGVGPRSAMRAVVFSERVATLTWLQGKLTRDLALRPEQVAVLHGGLSDVEQQEIVESFKLASSPIRVLVTGDLASEGVNLHAQCHHLVHYDIPWSLIRIEQRNGRIDRYGQRHSPRITTLLLRPDADRFAGDFRVLTRLVEREHEAHRALGDAASLIGTYNVKAEEDEILAVIQRAKRLDDVVRSPGQVAADSGPTGMLARLLALGTTSNPAPDPTRSPASPSSPSSPGASGSSGASGTSGTISPTSTAGTTSPTSTAGTTSPTSTAGTAGTAGTTGLFDSDVDLLAAALEVVTPTPAATPPNGLAWQRDRVQQLASLIPPRDLAQRLQVLPQSYLRDRRVSERLLLATTGAKGERELVAARSAESTSAWPEAHFLGPLHPVLDWAADRVLAELPRAAIFAVRGAVEFRTVLLQGTLTNARGQVIASTYHTAQFLSGPERPALTAHGTAAEALDHVGLAGRNTGDLADAGLLAGLDRLIAPAVAAVESQLPGQVAAIREHTIDRVATWQRRAEDWSAQAGRQTQHRGLKSRARVIDAEHRLAADMLPDRTLVRPLLVIVPDAAEAGEG